jgi:hypothetical protein
MLSQRKLFGIALVVQALLLFSNLGLLPLWGDEMFTYNVLKLPVSKMFEALSGDVHPPLFYLLERYWMDLPFKMDEIAKLRLLPALFAWAASAWTLWMAMSRLSDVAWRWFAALVTLSPCLVLYGRMGRSYSLQLLVMLVAVDQFLRLRKNPTMLRAAAYGLALTVVMYTHYAPAAAMGLAGAILMITARQYRALVLSSAVALMAYSPWIPLAWPAFSKWGTRAHPYQVMGNAVAEQVVKLGFWGLSFFFGESVPILLFFLAIPVSLGLCWLAWQGRGRVGEWGWLALLLAVLGYIAVSRWVSYPFIPARMLFVLPFAFLLLASGFEARPAAGRIILGTLLVCSAAGLISYYRVQDYLNWAYAVPYPEMAGDIYAQPGPTLVNQGGVPESAPLMYYTPQITFQFAESPRNPEEVAKEIADGRWKRVFVMHNTHDPSPEQFYQRLHRAMVQEFPGGQPHYYRLRGDLDLLLFKLLGWKDMAPYFFELDEYERYMIPDPKDLQAK